MYIYYLYKITFEEDSRYFYIGQRRLRKSKKIKCAEDDSNYLGSPSSPKNRYFWMNWTPKKQILHSSYKSGEELSKAEYLCIKENIKSKFCLNQSCFGISTSAASFKSHLKKYFFFNLKTEESGETYDLRSFCYNRGLSYSSLLSTQEYLPKTPCFHHRYFKIWDENHREAWVNFVRKPYIPKTVRDKLAWLKTPDGEKIELYGDYYSYLYKKFGITSRAFKCLCKGQTQGKRGITKDFYAEWKYPSEPEGLILRRKYSEKKYDGNFLIQAQKFFWYNFKDRTFGCSWGFKQFCRDHRLPNHFTRSYTGNELHRVHHKGFCFFSLEQEEDFFKTIKNPIIPKKFK